MVAKTASIIDGMYPNNTNDWFSSCVVPNVATKSLSGINPTGL
jgi:hypothetical protein